MIEVGVTYSGVLNFSTPGPIEDEAAFASSLANNIQTAITKTLQGIPGKTDTLNSVNCQPVVELTER